MPRRDLMELTADDLASLTNRGTVKRAQKEIESKEFVVEFEEGPDERVLAKWSDGFVCEFHHGKSIHDAKCSSGVLGISRHVIRSVLAYQRFHAAKVASESESLSALDRSSVALDPLDIVRFSNPPSGRVEQSEGRAVRGKHLYKSLHPPRPLADPPRGRLTFIEYAAADANLVCERRDHVKSVAGSPPQESTWDPGEFTDEQLISHFGKSQIQRARARFDAGILIELTRGRKPFAVFLDERCFVRFMVPHDLQYATADCSESQLAKFVAMTVWAFRNLPKEKHSGILSLSLTALLVPTELLDRLDATLAELVSFGIANSAQSSVHRWLRLESELRTGELTWPAQLVSELIHQIEMYQQHDALFDPDAVVLRIGELVARSRAIRSNTKEVPQLLIRGTKFDTAREIASSKYVGIGTEVKSGRKHTVVSVYLQEENTGLLATIQRAFANETTAVATSGAATEAKPFEVLAATPIYRGIRLSGLASSRVLLKTGKRTPSSELILPRSTMAVGVNPQLFRWETLKPPLLADSFAELVERIESMPPSYLRPRQLTDAVHVVPVHSIEAVDFDSIRQTLSARVTDTLGGAATMFLPYESRNDLGFRAFAEALGKLSAVPKFVAGRFRMVNGQLLFLPMQIVLEDETQRYGLNPYVSPSVTSSLQPETSVVVDKAAAGQIARELLEQVSDRDSSPISNFLAELNEYLAESILMGVRSNSDALFRRGFELAEHATRIGFVRIAMLLQSVTDEFQSIQNSRDRPTDLAARMLCELAMICRIASR